MRIKLILLLLSFTTAVQAQTCDTNTIEASAASSDFTDNGNGTVSDVKTGLMWKKCPEGLSGFNCDSGGGSTMNWQGALQLPEALNVSGGFASYTDWRLPNFKELLSIVEHQCNNPAINLAVFPNSPVGAFWSGSPNASDSGYAWNVHFYNGTSDSSYRGNSRSVRLVRVGQ